jgi:hemoglobin
MTQPMTTVFDQVGGFGFFHRLVDRFYEGVEDDLVLRPLYPDDLAPGKAALAFFLGQYWGGPTTYSDARGHPRLRMRHAPFRIGAVERDRWLHHMSAAVRDASLDPAIEAAMLEYFTNAADHMINTH